MSEPRVVQLEMDDETLAALASLMAPVTLWARAQGAPDPGAADVIGLAVRVLAAQVGGRAGEMIADGEPSSLRPHVH